MSQVQGVTSPVGLQVYVRLRDGREKGPLPVERLPLFTREDLLPWRVPKSYKNQAHKPGYYWHSQLKELVLCESRLELTTLKRIDFEEKVRGILPQPLRIAFSVNGKEFSHIPDFLVWQPAGCKLINVKPRAHHGTEKNRLAFEATDMLTRRIGWIHEVHGEPERAYLQNLRWLAAFRRTPYLFDQFSRPLQSRLVASGMEFEHWIGGVGDDALVRPAAFHLMWKRAAVFDMNMVLSSKTTIRGAI